MRFVFAFPDIGEGITEGKIVEWYVEKGMALGAGDPVVQMETDKVVTDIPSPKSGTVVSRFGREGDTVNVGDSLIEIDIPDVSGADAQKLREESLKAAAEEGKTKIETVEEGNAGVVGTLEVAGNAAYLPASSEGVSAEPQRPQQVRQTQETLKGTDGTLSVMPEGGRPASKRSGSRQKSLATPVARAMANNLGVDINGVRGTGPAGRVTKKDVEDAAKAVGTSASGQTGEAAPAGVEGVGRTAVVEISQLRKTIASRMMTSRRETAFMSVFEEVEISRLEEALSRYRPEFADRGVKLTYLPFIVKAVTRALTEHPVMNSEIDFAKGIIIQKKYYNIGIAVDTDEGLFVPVLREADKKNIGELAGEIAGFAEKARNKKITLEDMKDGTFSISNYGPIGGLFATPIINYPQTGILGVGRIVKRPVVADGGIVPGLLLPLSLSADHRVIDGGEAARFLNTCMRNIADPVRMVLE